MALHFFDGFDTHRAFSTSEKRQLQRKWSGAAGSQLNANIPGRVLGLASISFSQSRTTFPITHAVGTPVFAHWAQRWIDEIDNVDAPALAFRDVNNLTQLAVRPVRVTGDPSTRDGQKYRMEVARGATILATSTQEFWANKWYVFQVSVTIDPVVGAFDLRVSEGGTAPFTAVMSGSGVDTAEQITDDLTLVGLDWGSAAYDDFILWDSTPGGIFTGFLANAKLVVPMLVSGDGAQTDWVVQGGASSTADALDDVPADGGGGDAGRITSDTPTDIALVNMDDLSDLPLNATVQAVKLESFASMESSGTRTVQHVYRNLATTITNGSSHVVVGATVLQIAQLWLDNPTTASAWTVQELRDAQFGYEVIS